MYKINRVNGGESKCRKYGELTFGRKQVVAVPSLHPAVTYLLPSGALCRLRVCFSRRCFFMSKFQRRKNSQTLLRVTTSAMMIALSIVFCRVLGFPTTGMWRVEIGFLPILIVAILYGPVWSAVSYGLADFIGALIWTGINPFILICKIVFGLLMGLVFYRKEKIGFPRNVFFFLLVGFVVDIVMMTPIFVFMFGYTWDSALIWRLAAFSVNTPVRIVLTVLTDKFLLPSVYKYKKKN